MFVLSISLLLLSIHYGDCGRTATATLYQDNTTAIDGLLTIYQDIGAAQVMVTGMIFGLASNTAHVCLLKD